MSKLMQEFYRIENLTSDRCEKIIETRDKLSTVYGMLEDISEMCISVLDTVDEEIALLENLIDSMKCNEDDVNDEMLKSLKKRLLNTIEVKRHLENYINEILEKM